MNAVISEWGVARAVPVDFKPPDYREGEGKDKVGPAIFFNIHLIFTFEERHLT